MQLDQRLDAYAELVSRYARNSVSLEHAHMINRGSANGYLEVAKYELRVRKIVNRMDEIITVITQDNAYRQQAQFLTYPTPTINPINQMITSSAEADKIAVAAQQEAEEIMAIAFPSGTQPLVVIADSTTTQTVQSVSPTAKQITTVIIAANCLNLGKPQRPASPSFTMNTITENHPGATVNPLLTVNMENEGNINSFITLTIATNCQNHQNNQNTVVFDNITPEADKHINLWLAEIANQGTTETTVTNHHDHPVPNRCQFTNLSEHHQNQSTYTNQNRSYTNTYK